MLVNFALLTSAPSQDSKYLAALSDVRLEGSNEAVYFVLRGLGMKTFPGVAFRRNDLLVKVAFHRMMMMMTTLPVMGNKIMLFRLVLFLFWGVVFGWILWFWGGRNQQPAAGPNGLPRIEIMAAQHPRPFFPRGISWAQEVSPKHATTLINWCREPQDISWKRDSTDANFSRLYAALRRLGLRHLRASGASKTTRKLITQWMKHGTLWK